MAELIRELDLPSHNSIMLFNEYAVNVIENERRVSVEAVLRFDNLEVIK